MLSVGRSEHLDALRAWPGRVIVKLESELRRYGGPGSLVDDARSRGLDVIGVAVHPPIAGTDADRIEQIRAAVVDIDPRSRCG